MRVVQKWNVRKLRTTCTFSVICYKSQERTFLFIEIIGNTEQFPTHLRCHVWKLLKWNKKSSSQHSLLQEAKFLFRYLGRRQKPWTTYHVQNTDTNKECSFHQQLWEGYRKGWLENEMAWAETSVWEWHQVHKLFLDSCNKKCNKMPVRKIDQGFIHPKRHLCCNRWMSV